VQPATDLDIDYAHYSQAGTPEVKMNYVVSGADRATGKELTITFEAKSAAEAESIASLSMLVSEVRLQQPAVEPVDYATPAAAPGPAAPNWEAGIPFYAKLLRILSTVLLVLAIFPLVGYVLELGASVWQSTTSGAGFDFLLDFLRAATSGRLVLAVEFVTAAFSMRLASHVALAFREMAMRNR
jgi:hypothetical protein